MAPRTVPLDDTARTLAAIDHAIAFDPNRPIIFGITGSGKSRSSLLPAVEVMLGNATLRAALENARGEYDRLAARYAALLTAAQAAVIEARTSRRNPLTPIAEALDGLGELPAADARLADLPLATAAAWPRGSEH
jgi:hypothetical protein